MLTYFKIIFDFPKIKIGKLAIQLILMETHPYLTMRIQ